MFPLCNWLLHDAATSLHHGWLLFCLCRFCGTQPKQTDLVEINTKTCVHLMLSLVWMQPHSRRKCWAKVGCLSSTKVTLPKGIRLTLHLLKDFPKHVELYGSESFFVFSSFCFTSLFDPNLSLILSFFICPWCPCHPCQFYRLSPPPSWIPSRPDENR